jgi:hypothetical protein
MPLGAPVACPLKKCVAKRLYELRLDRVHAIMKEL